MDRITTPEDRTIKKSAFFAASAILTAAAVYFFYLKYVPLVTSFQVFLLPVLGFTFLLTAWNVPLGILFFLFSYPLVNSLPYFFGIFENTPHAPTALVLFLFFLLGWLLNRSLFPEAVRLSATAFKPLVFFSSVVILSAVITVFRFANFFPFRTDAFYELVTNTSGVSAGGAIMSTVFHALNYLTGFLFFLILYDSFRTEGFIRKAVTVLASSLFLSLLFGLVQQFIDPRIGNTPFWVEMKQINSTFKDPNAFGVCLALIVPVILGLFLSTERLKKGFFLMVLILVLFVFPMTGTRSAFLGVSLSFGFFLFIWFLSARRSAKSLLQKKNLWGSVLIIVSVFLAGTILTRIQPRLVERLGDDIAALTEKGRFTRLSGLSPERFFLWKEAVNMTEDYPLSGVGVGAFIIELPNYYRLDKTEYDPGLEYFRRIDSAENYFLHAAAELGLTGLFFAAWLFTAVFRRAFLGFGKNGVLHGDKFLYLGAVAGLISYLVNLFFHSYIGSFEAKYTFWLLAAVIFSLNRPTRETGSKTFLPRAFSFLSLVLVIGFAACHSWNSVHSLSLESRSERFGLEQNFGFFPAETADTGEEFRWSGSRGGMTVTVDKPVLEIPIHAAHPDISVHPVEVEIFLSADFFKHTRLLKKISLSGNDWEKLTLYLPGETGKKVILLFRVSRTWNPKKRTGTPDPRDLGVAVGRITFKDGLP